MTLQDYINHVNSVLCICNLPKLDFWVIEPFFGIATPEEWVIDVCKDKIEYSPHTRKLLTDICETCKKPTSDVWKALSIALKIEKTLDKESIQAAINIVKTGKPLEDIPAKISADRVDMALTCTKGKAAWHLIDRHIYDNTYEKLIKKLRVNQLENIVTYFPRLKILPRDTINSLLETYCNYSNASGENLSEWILMTYPKLGKKILGNSLEIVEKRTEEIHKISGIKLPYFVIAECLDISVDEWKPDFQVTQEDKHLGLYLEGLRMVNSKMSELINKLQNSLRSGWKFVSYILNLREFVPGTYYIWKNNISAQFIENCGGLPEIISVDDEYPELVEVNESAKIRWELLISGGKYLYKETSNYDIETIDKIVDTYWLIKKPVPPSVKSKLITMIENKEIRHMNLKQILTKLSGR